MQNVGNHKQLSHTKGGKVYTYRNTNGPNQRYTADCQGPGIWAGSTPPPGIFVADLFNKRGPVPLQANSESLYKACADEFYIQGDIFEFMPNFQENVTPNTVNIMNYCEWSCYFGYTLYVECFGHNDT